MDGLRGIIHYSPHRATGWGGLEPVSPKPWSVRAAGVCAGIECMITVSLDYNLLVPPDVDIFPGKLRLLGSRS